MLRLYISYTAADARQLATLREWLQPLVEKYNLYVWFNHPEPAPVVPFPWNVLFFWWSPSVARGPYHRNLHTELEQAHIYLFLVSQKSVNTPWIEQEEVVRAVSRYQRLGSKYIRICPVLLSSSQWKRESKLANFPTLGPPGRALNQVNPPEDGWMLLTEQLRPIIEELRRNWMEETKRIGNPVESFNLPAPGWNDAPEEVLPLPNWLGWMVVFFIGWSVLNWYGDSCKPRYKPYFPKKEVPEEYRRENPLAPPPPNQEVVPRDSNIRIIQER